MPEQAPQVPQKIEGRFEDSPEGWYSYWTAEFRAAREDGGDEWLGISRLHTRGDEITQRFLGNPRKREGSSRLNLFTSSVDTLRALLFGNTPKAEVTREFDDADDDDARVACEIASRLLNAGIENETSGVSAALRLALDDRLLPGIGMMRVEFSADFETVPEMPAKMGACPECSGIGRYAPGSGMGSVDCPACGGAGERELAPAVPAAEKPVNECAEISYVHWRDQLWSRARTFQSTRWWAFAAFMSRAELVKTFGQEGHAVPVDGAGAKSKEAEGRKESPWARAKVWEVWDKDRRRIHYVVEGYPRALQHVDNPDGSDPLGLKEFWPFPRPLMSHVTTSAFIPVPDFDIANDLYDEADELTSRIVNIIRQVKVSGVYDETQDAVKKLLDDASENQLLPVKNWAQFAEKNGLDGAFDLLPIDGFMKVVVALVQQRNMVIEQIYQITGIGDVVRGQQQAAETATTSAIKARFASVRLQDLQKEVARFVTDGQRIRLEVVAGHYSIETMIERSNIMFTNDAKDPQRIFRAANLLKSRHSDFRVSVKPEQVALQDFSALKQQRGEALQALGAYIQSMMPLVSTAAQGGPEAAKAAVRFVLNTAKWMIAGLPGSSGMESSFDGFLGELEKIAAQPPQPQQPRPPDPKIVGAQIKAQGDVAKTHAATQGRLAEIVAETQAEMARREHDAGMDVETTMAQERIKGVRAVDQLLNPAGP